MAEDSMSKIVDETADSHTKNVNVRNLEFRLFLSEMSNLDSGQVLYSVIISNYYVSITEIMKLIKILNIPQAMFKSRMIGTWIDQRDQSKLLQTS